MINTRMRIAPRTFFSSFVSICAACTMLAGPALGQGQGNDADVNVTEYGTIDLAVQETDLAQVLQMLSIQSQKNIITSRNVSATVTANLYDVTFHEALDSILRVNGYGYIEEGNFVYIYTKAELEEIERARRRTESRIFELEYLSARDAQEFVEPLLSDAGRISTRGEVRAGFQPTIDDGGADDYAFTAKIVVNDYPEHLDAIAELVRELDTAPQQVLVEATVLRTILNEENAFGIDFSIIGSMNFTDLFHPLSAVTDLLRADNVPGDKATEDAGFQPADNRAHGVTSTVGQTRERAGLRVGVIRDEVSVFMRVLDEVSDTTVLARPKIMALNRQRAQVLVGTRVGYLSTTATDTSATQRVEFLDTGIQLRFRPFISRSGMIRMELAPSVSDFGLRRITDAEGRTVEIPDEFTNELTTNVRVRDGQTLVLGGLFQEEIDKTRRQIPVLGDVPLLGVPFRGHDDRVRRSEIIFLITPSIVHDEALWDMGRDSLAYAESVQVGARKGLLPFSRERITASYNRKAMEALNRGDTNRAHHYINNSLRLNSNQPELIRLRQQVTGVREKAFERSVLERVMRKQLGELADPMDDSQSWRGQKNLIGAVQVAPRPELPTPPQMQTKQETHPSEEDQRQIGSHPGTHGTEPKQQTHASEAGQDQVSSQRPGTTPGTEPKQQTHASEAGQDQVSSQRPGTTPGTEPQQQAHASETGQDQVSSRRRGTPRTATKQQAQASGAEQQRVSSDPVTDPKLFADHDTKLDKTDLDLLICPEPDTDKRVFGPVDPSKSDIVDVPCPRLELLEASKDRAEDEALQRWALSAMYIRFGFPNFFAVNQWQMHSEWQPEFESAQQPGSIAGAAGADQRDK